MKVSAVISAKSLSAKKINKAVPSVVIAALPLILGVIFGSIIYFLSDQSIFDSLKTYFLEFATEFSGKNKSEIISGLIVSYIPYVIIMLIFGMCACGTAPIFLVSFLKSAGIGMTATYIYDVYALKGLEYCLLVFYPGKIIAVFAMLVLTHSCYAMSKEISSSVKGKCDSEVRVDRYIVRTLLISSIFAVSSIIEFLTIVCFSELFSFS